MTYSVKHKFVNLHPDDLDTTITRNSNWNDEHAHTMSSGKVLGRLSLGDGDVEEVAAREVLVADRTYYVGFVVGSPAISIASPAVATLAAHGLSVDDAVVFNVPENRTLCTISAASPAVVTMANNFAAGRPVQFLSSGMLPSGIINGTTYYVIAAGLSASQFEISATVGGSAINTTAITAAFTAASTTITTGANHNLVVGQMIKFGAPVGSNYTAGTTYYVISTPAANTLTCATSPFGTPAVGGSIATGTLVQNGVHYNSTAGSLPTGITAGVQYFVGTVPSSSTFTLSTTTGNANPVNTSGSVTGSPIYSVYTGNDSNDGLTQTRSGALLTLDHGVSIVTTIDFGTNFVTVQVCDGIFTDCIVTAWTGGGGLNINGNLTMPSNCIIDCVVTGIAVFTPFLGFFQVQGFKVISMSGGGGAVGLGQEGAGLYLILDPMEFGEMNGGYHLSVDTSAALSTASGGGPGYLITGGGSKYVWANSSGLYYTSQGFTLLGTPHFSEAFLVGDNLGNIVSNGIDFTGGATGKQFTVDLNSLVGPNSSSLPGNIQGTSARGGQPY